MPKIFEYFGFIFYFDPRKFSHFTIDSGNVVWGKNWDLIFPIEQLHAGVII